MSTLSRMLLIHGSANAGIADPGVVVSYECRRNELGKTEGGPRSLLICQPLEYPVPHLDSSRILSAGFRMR